jgi:hypothetical protein
MYDAWRAVVQRLSVNTPWGLRLTGGVDCFQPLSVAQVRKRSLADKAGLKVGDLVTSIEGIATDNLTHRQVIDIIGSQRLSLTFELARRQPWDAMSYSSSVSFQPLQTSDNRSLVAHGLLAYLPIVPPSTSDIQLQSSTATFSPIDGPSSYKPSYRAPPFKPQNAQSPPLKSYQPFDMTGNSSVHCTGPPKTKIFYTSPQSAANTFYNPPVPLPIQPSSFYTSPPPANTFYNAAPPPVAPAHVRSPPQLLQPYNYGVVLSPVSAASPPMAAATAPTAAISSYYADVSARPSV